MAADLAKCLTEKITDVIQKNYVALLPYTVSDVNYFSVPKPYTVSNVDYFSVPKVIVEGVVINIRTVYNGTSSGLNEAVWAPKFWLPTPDTAMRQLNFGYEMVNFDLGEMFLNFPLDRAIQPFTGVRMEGIAPNIEEIFGADFAKQFMAWTRLLMDFRPSPYLAIR
jgi:hypothetical protein